jgi:hypothetical protein
MYRSTVHTRRFDQDRPEDLRFYSEIVNNPLAMIISEASEKLSDREFGEEGITNIHEHIVKVVTWEERSLL